MKAAFGLWIALALASPGRADESLCRPLAEMKEKAAAHNVRWTGLSSEQWRFAQGAFVLAPSTPPGMPFGDGAALLQPGDEKDGAGVIVFVDGDKSCEPMPVPQEFVKMLLELGTIAHEGTAF